MVGLYTIAGFLLGLESQFVKLGKSPRRSAGGAKESSPGREPWETESSHDPFRSAEGDGGAVIPSGLS
jgi:hypothetical protein